MQSEDRTYEMFSRGLYYMESGDRENAIECFSRVVAENPANILSHKYRGECYFQIGRYEEAIRDFVVAINNAATADVLNSDLLRSLRYKCACAYLANGDLSAAAEHLFVLEENVDNYTLSDVFSSFKGKSENRDSVIARIYPVSISKKYVR